MSWATVTDAVVRVSGYETKVDIEMTDAQHRSGCGRTSVVLPPEFRQALLRWLGVADVG